MTHPAVVQPIAIYIIPAAIGLRDSSYRAYQQLPVYQPGPPLPVRVWRVASAQVLLLIDNSAVRKPGRRRLATHRQYGNMRGCIRRVFVQLKKCAYPLYQHLLVSAASYLDTKW